MDNLKASTLHYNGLAYDYLGQGGYGAAFIEREHGFTVIKVANLYILKVLGTRDSHEDTIEHEIQITNLVTSITPEYTCGPVRKIRTDEGFTGMYMNAAGQNLYVNNKQLTNSELRLISLQLIHLLLRISNRILMEDLKTDHIFFIGRHGQIQLKLIDFGECREAEDDSAWHTNTEIITWNLYIIFRDGTSDFARSFTALCLEIQENLPDITSGQCSDYAIHQTRRMVDFIMEQP